MGSIKDAFAGIDRESMEIQNPETSTPTPPEPQRQTPPTERREFAPAVSAETESEALPIDPDSIFSFGREKFEDLVKARPESKPTESGQYIEKTAAEALPPEMIEISASMYVAILETIWGVVCEWFSGVSGNYEFEKKMKSQYEQITAVYFKIQNVQLTPSHFFALMTAVVLFAPGMKAYKDKKRRLTAESFAKKSRAVNAARKPGEQATLFDVPRATAARQYFAAEKGKDGRLYYIMYPEKVDGRMKYAPQAERELVPPELVDFIPSFKARNDKWPTAQQVSEFLKS